jgi:hypothetical protein
VAPVLDDHVAVHDDHVDALGKQGGLLVGGPIVHPVQVEDHDVGPHPSRISPRSARRIRVAGQEVIFRIGVLQGEGSPVPDVASQDSGKGPVAPGVGKAQAVRLPVGRRAGVTSDADPGLLHGQFQVRLVIMW